MRYTEIPDRSSQVLNKFGMLTEPSGSIRFRCNLILHDPHQQKNHHHHPLDATMGNLAGGLEVGSDGSLPGVDGSMKTLQVRRTINEILLARKLETTTSLRNRSRTNTLQSGSSMGQLDFTFPAGGFGGTGPGLASSREGFDGHGTSRSMMSNGSFGSLGFMRSGSNTGLLLPSVRESMAGTSGSGGLSERALVDDVLARARARLGGRAPAVSTSLSGIASIRESKESKEIKDTNSSSAMKNRSFLNKTAPAKREDKDSVYGSDMKEFQRSTAESKRYRDINDNDNDVDHNDGYDETSRMLGDDSMTPLRNTMPAGRGLLPLQLQSIKSSRAVEGIEAAGSDGDSTPLLSKK